MLDSNSLQQLTQLKETIREQKNLFPGTVKGTSGRFGFVTLDDGREGFLAPDEMARVLPGDRVEVSVTEKTNSSRRDRVDVELDKLLSSNAGKLVGQYTVRDRAHFIAIDMPQLKRWLFIPPKARGRAKAGDYVVCKLTRHPFEDGRGQVKVVEVIGCPDDNRVEHKFICMKHNLPTRWTQAAEKQADLIAARTLEDCDDIRQRRDLSELAFVTIDAATTRDIDDALLAEANDSGWLLRVAVADPTASIEMDSALDRAAGKRATTAYLPGSALTMLPELLAHDRFSLAPEVSRPALLCEMQVNRDGKIEACRFEFVVVRSHLKLSYDNVNLYLQGETGALPEDCLVGVNHLSECSRALKAYRQHHLLLMEEQDDYELQLDERGHIADIQRRQRGPAQQLVEECMLATNRCAGEFFRSAATGHTSNGDTSTGNDTIREEDDPTAIFSAHDGFRCERLEAITAMLKEDFPEMEVADLTTLTGYRQLVRSLQARPDAAAHLAALRLMLQPGRLTTQPDPHLGLGMECYATITSPIRRYNDMHNHRVLRAMLTPAHPAKPGAVDAAQLQERAVNARNASRDLEQWLSCLFMLQHKSTTFEGRIERVTSQGVSVRLSDWGITGFVKLDPKKFRFDEVRMTLQSDDTDHRLGRMVRVQVERIDMDKKRINFKLQ